LRYLSKAAVATIAATALLSACSSMPRIDAIEPGEKVAIRLHSDRSGTADARVANKTVAKDAGTGAASGAVAGAVLGLSCGPLVFICSPLGAVAGATTGGAAGLLVGVAASLPADKKEALDEELTTYLTDHKPDERLLDALTNRVEGQWTLTDETADKTVVLSIVGVGLNTHRRERVTLRMRARVDVYDSMQGEGEVRGRNFDYESAPSYVQSWIDNRDGFVTRQFEDGFRTLAEEMALVLTGR